MCSIRAVPRVLAMLRLPLLVVWLLAGWPGAMGHAFAQAFTQAGQCVVGKRVVNRDNQAGVIASVDGSSCRVKLDATGKIDYNIFWMLRPEAASANASPGSPPANGAAPTRPAASPAPPVAGAGIPPGVYKCYLLVGSALNYAFIDIHIDGPDRYRDKSGTAGRYTLGANNRISFTGPLAGASGQLMPGPRIGLNMNGGSFYNTSCSG